MPTLKARSIYVDDEQQVVVIESLDVRREKHDVVLGFLARLEPVAVVVSDVNGPRAVDINAETVDIDRLLDDVEELGALLEQ